ncbi:MAG TPA: hypothetical protein VFQ39_09155, partial [Longimicrobium sp.]|nr:hypothetical protein [Longimicrobium sp.]
MHRRFQRVLTTALALSIAAPGALSAQCAVCDDHAPRLRGEALTLATNALLGGVTAGVRRMLAGGSFGEGFAPGAAGGALTYAGKRIAVEEFDGAGLLGREVAAVGSSISRNAAEGRPALESVMLPAGPVRLYLGGEGAPVHLRLDAAAVVAAAYTMTLPDTRFDAGESLSSGALVFHRAGRPEALGYNGAQAAGVVQVRRPGGFDAPLDARLREQVERTTRHERVHVIQYDQSFLLWSAPAEAWLMEKTPLTRAISRYVDLGLNAPAMAGL